MAIFLVVPLRSDSTSLDRAIQAKFEEGDRYQLQDKRGWLVRHNGTTKEVSDFFGLTGQKEGERSSAGSALVTPVASYYGRGPTDMWEWLKSRFES